MSNESKVVEALRDLENRIVQRLSWLREGSPIDMDAFTADIETLLQAHAAEAALHERLAEDTVLGHDALQKAAQPQAQSGVTDEIVDRATGVFLKSCGKTLRGEPVTCDIRAALEAVWPVAAPQAQAAEPVSLGDIRTLLECLEDEHGGEHFDADCRHCQAYDRLVSALTHPHPPAQDAEVKDAARWRKFLELKSAWRGRLGND